MIPYMIPGTLDIAQGEFFQYVCLIVFELVEFQAGILRQGDAGHAKGQVFSASDDPPEQGAIRGIVSQLGRDDHASAKRNLVGIVEATVTSGVAHALGAPGGECIPKADAVAEKQFHVDGGICFTVHIDLDVRILNAFKAAAKPHVCEAALACISKQLRFLSLFKRPDLLAHGAKGFEAVHWGWLGLDRSDQESHECHATQPCPGSDERENLWCVKHACLLKSSIWRRRMSSFALRSG